MAMLHRMAQLMRSPSSDAARPKRVLLAAHTNTAVDRVLLGLLDSGCTGACWSQLYPKLVGACSPSA